jgi:hypothetical protein
MINPRIYFVVFWKIHEEFDGRENILLEISPNWMEIYSMLDYDHVQMDQRLKRHWYSNFSILIYPTRVIVRIHLHLISNRIQRNYRVFVLKDIEIAELIKFNDITYRNIGELFFDLIDIRNRTIPWSMLSLMS